MPAVPTSILAKPAQHLTPKLEPGAGGAPVPEAPTDLDPPQVAAEIIDPANKAAVQAAADRLTTVVHDLTDKISHLSNSDILMFRNGQSMTGAEIKSLWNKIDFLVTDRNNFGLDRGGTVVGYLSQMNLNTVAGYDAWSNGLSFIAMHEMMHMTDIGKAYDLANWQAYSAGGGTLANYNSSNSYFRDNESFVNNAANSLVQMLGLPITSNSTGQDPTQWFPPYGVL